MTHQYTPHATDWLTIGTLIGAVVLIAMFWAWFCSWWASWGEAEHDPVSPEELDAECFTDYR